MGRCGWVDIMSRPPQFSTPHVLSYIYTYIYICNNVTILLSTHHPWEFSRYVPTGVNQASYVGDDKGKIEVAGDQVDAVKLTITLKKMVGYAVLESVAEAKEGGDEKKEKEGEGDKEKDGANLPPPVGIYPHSPYTIYNCY